MLSFEGNTAPYLQYAYTRIQSIFRRSGIDKTSLNGPIAITTSQEQALSLKLLQFAEAVEQVTREALPHVLCTYLYDLASLFMSFYEACPILKSDIPEDVRNSRLQLCKASAAVVKQGLELLGIEVMEKM